MVGIQSMPEPDEEAPVSILTGLLILNICNDLEQRIQITLVGDEWNDAFVMVQDGDYDDPWVFENAHHRVTIERLPEAEE